jgi:nucleotide-binding universal stress UspA family protein
MYERVVLPLDDSKLAEGVFEHLGELVSPDAILYPTMVIEPVVFVGLGGHAIWDEGTEQMYRAEAFTYLRAAMEENGYGNARFRCVVKLHVTPARAIVETAIEERADLIAMTSHGRTGLSRLVLGSVAWAVLRLSPVTTRVFSAKKLALAS